MELNAEIILEGTYLYSNKNQNYSEENFKLVHLKEAQIYYIYAEVLSRIETGEFLKIKVRLEMDQHYQATFLRVEKSLGNRYALEESIFDPNSQEFKYSFQTSDSRQDFQKSLSAKRFLTSPAFSTSTLFTLTKKFDATGRTAVVLLTSSNDWTYVKPPEEKIVYAEFKAWETNNFELNGHSLPASHLMLYESDFTQSSSDLPVEVYISKHYGIPYQLTHGDQKIVVKNLKKLN